jgi:uncharacterized HhH-GPD family protein
VGIAHPTHLWFTDDEESCRLLADDPFALLVGFALDQQITVQQAFAGPLRIKQRLGTLDPGALAATDPAALEAAFREKPAIHRFPGAMATRVQDLAQAVVDDFGGDAANVWRGATTSAELKRRIGSLPGFGEMKVKALASVLARRYGLAFAEELLPDHQMLGDVDSPQALVSYQAAKRAYKASLRAAAKP